MMDNLFLLAVASFGFGLSLATYRLFAKSNGWPMGALQADLPFIPVLIGLAGLLAGLLFAAARGFEDGGGFIIVFGLVLALIWTGFVRVGSQIALFIVPVVTFLLFIGWFSVPILGPHIGPWAREQPGETLSRKLGTPDDVQPAPGEAGSPRAQP